MPTRDVATLLAVPTLTPTDLSAAEAELMAAQTLEVLLTDITPDTWESAGEVLGRLAPSVGDSLVLVVLARAWAELRRELLTEIALGARSPMPQQEAVRGLRGALSALGWMRKSEPGDAAVKARYAAHKARRTAALEDPEGFEVPADAEDRAMLAAGTLMAPLESAVMFGPATRVLERLGESGGSEFLAVLRRVLDGLPVHR